MAVPFWEATIFAGVGGYALRERFGRTGSDDLPQVWCAQRFGQSCTLLANGRAVLIGGEQRRAFVLDLERLEWHLSSCPKSSCSS